MPDTIPSDLYEITILTFKVTLWCKYYYRFHCITAEQVDCVLQTESLSGRTDMFINNYNAISVIGTQEE